MIRKQDILDRSAEWRLRPEVVEKDYVLGWLLAGIGVSSLRPAWIFKGGTSIKKCYFETYRFSEDLDFSLVPDAPYTQDEIAVALRDVVQNIHALSGVDFPDEHIEVRSRHNLQGQDTFECRIAYRGPLAYPGFRRVLFDLTRHEGILDAPTPRSIFHPYPDSLPEGVQVLTYSFDELLAEKTRALFERARPRDLYDVVYLLDNRPEAFDFAHVREIFTEKCSAKGLAAPSAADLIRKVNSDAELRSEWANMLAHQLPSLPELNAYLLRLPALLQWIDRPAAVPPEVTLPAAPVPADTIPVGPPGIQFWGSGLPLEILRFAGANRQLIAFDYDGRSRVAEPYSLRQAATGNTLLYAWEEGATHIKAFNVGKIQNLHLINRTFQPRYRIELTTVAAPSISSTVRHSFDVPATRSTLARRLSSHRSKTYGPRYIFECPYCQKRFTHRSNNPVLRKHKSDGGYWDCPGRRGYLVEVR